MNKDNTHGMTTRSKNVMAEEVDYDSPKKVLEEIDEFGNIVDFI